MTGLWTVRDRPLRVETTSPVDGEAVSRAATSGLRQPYVRCTPYSQHSRLRVRPGPNDCFLTGSKSTPAASDRLQTLHFSPCPHDGQQLHLMEIAHLES